MRSSKCDATTSRSLPLGDVPLQQSLLQRGYVRIRGRKQLSLKGNILFLSGPWFSVSLASQEVIWPWMVQHVVRSAFRLFVGLECRGFLAETLALFRLSDS